MTKHAPHIDVAVHSQSGAGAPDVWVTELMIEAGEAVLREAFELADVPISSAVLASVRDVYTAMARLSDC